ncbi:MAG: DUF2294 domain-containing protein [Cyanobacteria bacterium P01_C01_bin.120]
MFQQDSQKPTRGQLERSLSQCIQKLYREHLGHATGKVTCQLMEDKLTIVIESSLTQPEQLLLEESSLEKVEKIRADLDNIIRKKLIELVEETMHLQVLDVMGDTTLKTERTGFIIVLSDNPQHFMMREKSAKPQKSESWLKADSE